MLAKYYRLILKNATGQTLTYANDARITVRLCPWKISSGAMSYGTTAAQTTDFLNTGETIAHDGTSEGAVVDNSTDAYLGVKGYLEVTHDVSGADGTIYLYVEESDDNTNWPSDQAAFDVDNHCRLVAAMDVLTDAVDETIGMNFEI